METVLPEGQVVPKEASVNNPSGRVEISIPHVSLDSEKEPLRFSVTLEKMPTPVADGTVIENITVDRESPKLQEMFKQAAALKDIPNREKPRRLMEILRANVHFAYEDALNELANTNPDLAKWVAENTGVASSSARPLTLSQITEAGYGVCRHLSVGMLALAKEAGLRGAFLTNSSGMRGDPMPIKNIVRKDTNEPLFKMSPVGDMWGGHAWVELEVAQGEWVPVDPSTQLVGDTQEGMEIFKEANYRPTVGRSLDIEGLPNGVWVKNRDLEFFPGEAQHTGILPVNATPREKTIYIGKQKSKVTEEPGPWPKPRQYEGPLQFSLSSHESSSGMNVAVVSAHAV